MSNVKKVTDHPYSARWSEYWAVSSESRAGVIYVVAKARKDGTWGCSCPRWIYKREDCKHIQAARAASKMLERNAVVAEIRVDAMPEKAKKALSRFALLEV